MNATTRRQTTSAAPELGAAQLDIAVLMFAALTLYSVNIAFPLSGDAAMYSDYVLLGKFDEVTLHLAYYLVLSIFHRLLGGLFGIPVQESAAWLNVVAGTLSVGVAYGLAKELFGTRRDAFLCAVIFGLSGRVLANATSSEIYILQTLFVLSSFYLFARERVVLSGLLAGMAMLVSPLSVFAYLYYPVYDYYRARTNRWSVLFRLVGTALTVYIPYLIVDGRELLYGYRGLLAIHEALPFNLRTMLANFPVYMFKAFTFLPVLLIPMLFAWREYRSTIVLSLAVGLPHIYLICKLTDEDHVFILNSDFFFVCCLVIGWRQLEKLTAGKWIAPGLLLVHVGLFIASGTMHSFHPQREYAEEMRRYAKTYLLGHDAIMIADWGHAVPLVFYGRPQITTTIRNEPLFLHQIYDIQSDPLPPITNLNRPEIFLLDSWAPSPLSRFMRTKEQIEASRDENSVASIAARNLNLRCELIEETVYRVYRCVR